MMIIISDTQDTLNKHLLKEKMTACYFEIYVIVTWVQNNNPWPVPLRYSLNITSPNLQIPIDIRLLDLKSCLFYPVIMIVNACGNPRRLPYLIFMWLK